MSTTLNIIIGMIYASMQVLYIKYFEGPTVLSTLKNSIQYLSLGDKYL